MIELERTFLLKFFPDEIRSAEKTEMVDCYVPVGAPHCFLRIRKRGNRFEITKKVPVDDSNFSELKEETIHLSKYEFQGLSTCRSKDVIKDRYKFVYDGRHCEVDVFKGPLRGLVLVDFEFESKEDKDSFVMPDFCLTDVTQEDSIAGGLLAGKCLEDIRAFLGKYGYEEPDYSILQTFY